MPLRAAKNSVHYSAARLAGQLRLYLHSEAAGGVFLLSAAMAALLCANSSWRIIYESFIHLPITLGAGAWQWRFDVHFFISDILMSVFFLAAGVEIRQELHNGALAHWRQAALPLFAAVGGVCFPALIYWALNFKTAFIHGWAVPTATDIAFAIGVLALLGKAIPANIRVILLSLAIIDDIIAVLIITFFYSGGISWEGLTIAASAVILIMFLRFLGMSLPFIYVFGGALLWFGLWKMGIHPSLAGVVLGLLTPVLPPYGSRAIQKKRQKLAVLWGAPANKDMKAAGDKISSAEKPAEAKLSGADSHIAAAKQEEKGEILLRDLVKNSAAPAEQVRKNLHIWVAFAVMPLFAFVNAGVRFADADFSDIHSLPIFFGVVCGLVLGKPLGVLCVSFAAVKIGLCRLPPHLGWNGMILIGLLAGIGFTMALFVAMLAFKDKAALSLAVLGVLCGSALSAVFGLGYGFAYRRQSLKTYKA